MSETFGICACGHSEANHEFMENDGKPKGCQLCSECKFYDEEDGK